MDTLIVNWPQYVELVLAVVGACAAIAAITPNTADDAIVQTALDIINALGMNVGRAKNEREKSEMV